MMSLKPRYVNFQETWAKLKETVAGVVALQAVERAVWNTRFSDVYALCVAHPEPLADKLYDETRKFLEEHVSGLLQRVKGSSTLDSSDYNDGLLTRYVAAWREYSQGVAYLNSLYSYLNLQHVKRQKVSDAEIIYGSAATVSCPEHDSRQLEVGELGLVIWERVLVRPLAGALTARVVGALSAARDAAPDPPAADALRTAILSTVDVQSFRVRTPLSLYQQLVVEPFLSAAAAHHSRRAAELLNSGDVSHFMKYVLDGLEREITLGNKYLHSSSSEAVRACYEQACVAAHLPALHAEVERLLKEACEDSPKAGERREDLKRMYALLKPLGQNALRPLIEAAHAQAAREGLALLASEHSKDDAHTHFVHSMLSLHSKYKKLFAEVFGGAQAFVGALDKACSEVVNARAEGEACARAPELLSRYCDALLRRRSGGGSERDADERLAAAIVVFKYIDDKDVFQKHYARALARRLIHQLSASMEQEEAMINRLKAACGYEFTNKLHRMFTDVAVSADLNAKFQQYLRDNNLATSTGFFIQVLQPQCALLLMFETTDTLKAREAREALQLSDEAWGRHVRPLVEAGLLAARGAGEAGEASEAGEAAEAEELVLNLAFSCKRTKIRLTCAAAPPAQGGSGTGAAGSSESTHCDDDRKMYLQAAVVRIMKQRKVLRHTELIQEVVSQARGSFAPSVAMIKKCIEALIDKQYLERAPGNLDTYSYLA
ncbi:cullin-2 [Zerene cesonia]|uniref:cullin-2 n=1 Tax=Zerene cesonia TaxID=33412 RepID=UPI0018E562C9|nr:cullin-2 [Zerene cesonia]